MDETEQGNFFDQFDTSTPAQPTAAQANFFDQFDAAKPAPGPTSIGDKAAAFTDSINKSMTEGGVSDGQPQFKETPGDPKALAAIGDQTITGDSTAPDFGQDTEGYAQREAQASQHIGEAGVGVAKVLGNTAAGAAAGLGKDASKLARTGALIGGVLPAGYDALVGGHDAYDAYAKSTIQPFDQNIEALDDFAKDHGRAGTFGSHVGELGGDLALMASGAGEVNAAAKGAESGRALDIVGTALDKSADASKIVATQQAAQQVESVEAGGGSKLQATEAGLTTFATNVIANAIPAGIDGTLADRLGAGAAGGAVTGEFQRQVNNVVLPENMHQDFDLAGAGWNVLMQAGMGAVFHRAEMENPNQVAHDFNQIQRDAESGDPTAKQTATIVSNLSSVDGLNGAAITSAKLASVVHAETLNTPHDDLMTGSSRYAEIYNSAIDTLGPAGAQDYAKTTYASETSNNAAWDSYFAAQNTRAKADMSSQVTQQINDLHTQAQQVVPPVEMSKLRRWAFDNQRTPLEVRKALYDTVAEKKAPEYIEDQYGEHFNDDGTLTQKAFLLDSANRPQTQHVTFENTPEVRQALDQGGVAPYKLDDGMLAVIGKPDDLNTLVDHVNERSGQPPATFGASHEVKAPEGSTESVEHPRPAEGTEGGEPAAGRGDAEDRKPAESGRSDEGNQGAEDQGISTERVKRAGEVIDTRLAALDESAKGVKSKRDLARLGREHDELEDLVRAQAKAKQDGVNLAPANRMSDTELAQAHTRMGEIKLALEAHRQAVAHKAEGENLRGKLAKAEDPDLVRIADNITNPRRAHVADALDGTPGVKVTARGEAVVSPDADAEAANKAMDVAGSDTGANTTDFAEPTAKQAAAGNYRKGGVLFKSPKGDVRVRIENPEGSVRKGKGWSRPVRGAHYGYIPGTKGADGDPLDVFLTRNAHDDTRPVAVISQHDPKTGKFDELKVVMGARTRQEAMELYGKQYPPGLAAKMLPDSKRNIVMMDRAKFNKFVASGNVDVPPHPVSGEPQLKYRAERQRDEAKAQLEADRRDSAALAQKAMNRETVAPETKPAQTAATPPKEPANGRPEEVSAAGPEELPGSGRVRGSEGGLSTPTRPGLEALAGHPSTVKVNGKKVTFGPDPRAQDAARDYAREAGLPYVRPREYTKVDEQRATRIADAFEKMEHAPNDPVVKAAYKAMVDETMAQWQAIKKTGLKVEFIKDGMEDPYAANPRLAIIDVNQNNHLWVFPTEAGFGGSESAHVDISGNPLLAKTGEVIDGHELLANDVFRIVHDYFGHVKEGIGFRADGEENAWRSHAAMYSPLARRAMTTETRGQNSWVNFGPHAEHNRTANGADTQYAPQKIGLLPEWASREGAPNSRDSEGPRYMYAGMQAKTMDRAALQDARVAESQGKATPDILAATGWQRGRDGDWRFEIPDNEAKIDEHRLAHPVDLDEGKTYGTVKDVLQHSELLKAYPQLGDIQIHQMLMKENELGVFTGTQIKLNARPGVYEKFGTTKEAVVIHELQHAVQQIEGWARGGNPNEFYEVMRGQADTLEIRINNAYDRARSLEKKGSTDEANELYKYADGLKKKYEQLGYTSDMKIQQIAHDKYALLAGEVEARNTVDRMKMTADDRILSPRTETQDREDDHQIVKFGEPGDGHDPEAMAVSHQDEIRAHVDAIAKKWKSSPEINVVRNRDELPPFLKEQMTMQSGGDIHPDAVYHDGKVFLLSDNITDTAHAERAVLHETMGHLGLRGTFGDKLNPLLDAIHASLSKDGRLDDLREQYGKAYGNMDEQALNRAIAEEHLAQLAESNSDPSAWAKIAAGIRKVLRSIGMVHEYTDNDLRVLMAGVAKDVREGRVSLAGQQPPEAQFDEEKGVVTSTYRGSAGEGTVAHTYDGSERLLHVDGLQAHLESFQLDGEPAIAVRALQIAEPSDLLKLTRFAGEEGKGVVAVDKETLSRRSLERSGIPFKDAGSHWVMPASRNMPDPPMYSLRNRAKGTAAQEAILKRSMIHAAEANLTPWDRMQAAMRSFRDDIQSGNSASRLKQAYVDALDPVARYERATNGGLLLDAAQSAYKAAWMAKNNEQITAGVMKLGVPEFKAGSFEPVAGRKGLLDILSPLYKTVDGKAQDLLWEGYAMAKRANELIQQTNPDGTSREKLLDQNDIDELLDLENKYPHFKTVFDEYQTFNKQLLDLAVERGTLSKDSADIWSKNMYVPFYRHLDDKNESNEWRQGKGISGKRVTSMKLKGSDKMVEPIIENILKNTGAVLDKVYANEAMRRVVALTDGIGMEKVKIPWQGTEVSAGDVEKAMARIGLHVGSKVGGKYFNHVVAADMDKLVTFFKMSKPQGPDIVSVMEGGKPYYYKVTDTQLYRAVTAFNDIGSFDKVLGAILGVPKKLITLGVTLDPRFMYRNLIRDGMTAWAQTGTNPNMVSGIAKNIKEVATDGEFLNRLRVAGYNGNEYFKMNEMRDFLQQMHGQGWTVLNTPKKLWQGYHKIGAISEQMNRMTIAKHTLANGGSMAEAAWQAQNTLNFNMRGDSRAFQLLIRAVPFLNARVQGLSRLYDGAVGRDVTQNRQRAVTSFIMKMAGIMAAGGALTAYNWDDKRYQRIPDAAKDTYYHFFIGDHHFTIPKPFEIGAIMTTLPERTARWLGGKDNNRTYVEALKRTFTGIFSFDPTPQIAKPLWDDYANRDSFSSTPIVNQQLSGLLPNAQQTPQTSPTIAGVAKAMPWWAPDILRSPVRLEHLVKGYTAQIGQYAIQAADSVARGTGVAPAAPESRYGNKWLGAIEGTFGQGEDATDPRNKYKQQLYDAQDNVDAAYKTLDTYIKQGRIEEARELMQNSKTPLAYRNAIKQTVKEMGELRKIETSIYADPNMSSEQKREQLNKITAVERQYLDAAAPMIETAADYYH